jgi:acyl carrier protein
MEKRFKEILATVLETTPDSIDESMSSDTVQEWDSLRQMNLIVALEEEFSIRFEEEESLLLNSYAALLQTVEKKTSSDR